MQKIQVLRLNCLRIILWHVVVELKSFKSDKPDSHFYKTLKLATRTIHNTRKMVSNDFDPSFVSGKHVRAMNTPLNSTFI